MILNFFCSDFRALETNSKFFLEKLFLFPDPDRKYNSGLTPLQIISEIEERNIFLITKSGLLKFKKWTPSTYVSTEITNFLDLSKKTSSVNSNDPGLSFDSLEK